MRHDNQGICLSVSDQSDALEPAAGMECLGLLSLAVVARASFRSW
jgi:hypothetical protein